MSVRIHANMMFNKVKKKIDDWTYCEVSPSSFPRQQGHTGDPRSGKEENKGHLTGRKNSPGLKQAQKGSGENDSGIVCMDPTSGADRNRQLRIDHFQ
ncbi:hypothetical protein AVEN_183772-1 [Araneus ventricosus]|uniref:Uncharacterized protein n=1 Tax=Araneus ventricosus TaxID=182803 RepID=A0A4Y2S389_ARAVE|nr:hypothetical protein AVEN_183772-1 [Araneus ventricosus]